MAMLAIVTVVMTMVVMMIVGMRRMIMLAASLE
jgi:hypothetical protein